MNINTVLGEIDKDSLGIISPHEHVYLDRSTWLVKNLKDIEKRTITEKKLFYDKVKISILGDLRINALSVLDNMVLDDEEIAIKEIMEFKKFGGNTIIDQTNEYMGRDLIALKNISIITGINIITSTGHYIEDMHPDYIEISGEEKLAEEMIREIKFGINDTNIKAGVIGEIGTSKLVSKNEKKVLRAAAIAQKETNVPLFIHTWPWGTNGIEILDILEKFNINMDKVVICHVDGKIDLAYCKELLNRGAFIEFENFGKDYGYKMDDNFFVVENDLNKIEAIHTLICCNENNIKKILIATDICAKIELKIYGGYGYAHILKNITKYMKIRDFTSNQIKNIIEINPKNLLS